MRGPLIVLLCVVGCGDSVDSMPPPLTTGPSSTTLPVDDTTGDTSSTTEVEQCPWDGTCSSLVPNAELCGALWALECGDGWRCIDTEQESGLVCPPWPETTGSSSEDSTSAEESSSGNATGTDTNGTSDGTAG